MTSSQPTRVAIVAQRQPVDEQLLEEFVADECTSLGVQASLDWTDEPMDLATVARSAAEREHYLLVVAGPGTPALDEVSAPDRPWVVRVDLQLCEPDPTPGLLAHIQGRGIDGVRWALRTVRHRARWPLAPLPYGAAPEQFGHLRLPRETDVAAPVVVLLHGGFWRSRWQLDLMDALAVDLAERGLASWNVDYRPPDRYGWAATVADIRAAVEHVAALAERFAVDPARVALVGHSAGGQLALQYAADGGSIRPALVVQLAGLVDLIETHRRDLGNGAVPAALGGTPEQWPEVYAAASPLARVPCDVAQLVVIGRSDSPDLREMSRRYVHAARDGGPVELIEDDGDHFTVIDPKARIWTRTVDAITRALRK